MESMGREADKNGCGNHDQRGEPSITQ